MIDDDDRATERFCSCSLAGIGAMDRSGESRIEVDFHKELMEVRRMVQFG